MTNETFRKLLNKMCGSYGISHDGCPLDEPRKRAGVTCKEYIEDHGPAVRDIVKGWALERGLLPDKHGGTPETRREILQAAERRVCGDRDASYGGPEDSFALIASLWEPIIRARCVSPGVDVNVDAVTVALLMAELKIARASTNTGHMDSWVDLVGYGCCGGEIAARETDVGMEYEKD